MTNMPMFDVPTPPALTWFASVDVQVDRPIDIGTTTDGVRRVVPIRGGRVRGEGWHGTVLDAGADFQQYSSPTTAYLVASYVLEVDGGPRLLVENRALRHGSAEALERLMQGEAVAPEEIYFRCIPRITAPEESELAWVNSRLFIGTGTRLPDRVQLEFFTVE